MRFNLTWSSNRSAYYVSIPNYAGGEVVTADEYDSLRDAAMALLDAWNQFTDPNVRVGPVWPRMRDVATVLGRTVRT